MKIKHFQGYGLVNAKVVNKGMAYGPDGFKNRYVIIEVWGNHEYGLEINKGDRYWLAQWLGKVGKFTHEDVKSFESKITHPDNEEHCIYTVVLNDIPNPGR